MVVAKAQELGSYEHLEKNEKELLIETLAAARVAKDTGIVWRPLVQMHDVQVICDCVCREVSKISIVNLEVTDLLLAYEPSLLR